MSESEVLQNFGLTAEEQNTNLHNYNHALFENMSAFLDVVWEMNLKTDTAVVMIDRLIPRNKGRQIALDDLAAETFSQLHPEDVEAAEHIMNRDFLANLTETIVFESRYWKKSRYRSLTTVVTPLRETGGNNIVYISIRDMDNCDNRI